MNLVQIGVWKSNDEFLKFVQSQLGVDKILLVDPMHHHDDIVAHYYDGIPYELVHKCCVGKVTEPTIEFYCSGDNGGYGAVSSTDPRHILRHGQKIIDQFSVEAVLLNDLLDERGLHKVEVLAVDAEGLDADIIMSLDLDRFDIKFITFEQIHTNAKGCIEFLKKHGYVQSSLDPFKDIVFEKVSA